MEIVHTKEGNLQKALMRLLPGLMPKHGKRAVFLTTLFMEVSKISPAHKEIIEELNKRFNLVQQDSALRFPMSLKEAVWDGRHLKIRQHEREGEMSEDELEGLARRIIANCREWSRYGDDQQVLQETKEVIRTSLLYHDINDLA